MAITKIHAIKATVHKAVDYICDPAKTDESILISSFGCSPETAAYDFKFALSKTSQADTNKAFHLIQSFMPSEVSYKEAHQIGVELADKLLEGKYSYIVSTHIDKGHVHNHIIFCAADNVNHEKYHDCKKSYYHIRHLNDELCSEHQLSVIEKPQRGSSAYNKWHGYQGKPSHRELLRIAIDDALEQKPHDFNAFLALLSEQGFQVKNGKHLTFVHADFKQNIRMYTLGDAYSEDTIRAVIKGQKIHQPKKRRTVWDKTRPQSIIDIQAKLAAGMGEGYRRWATIENLKRIADTSNFLTEHGIGSYEELLDRCEVASASAARLKADLRDTGAKIDELALKMKHVAAYRQLKPIYDRYKASRDKEKFLRGHESEIILFEAAARECKRLGAVPLPATERMQAEIDELNARKAILKAELQKAQRKEQDYAAMRQNVEDFLSPPQPEQERKKNVELE